jgi:tetratricopeptide (TPR) repeat protein
MHDLLREYAAERAMADESEVDRRAALGRVLDHYAHSGVHAALLLAPSREPVELEPASPGVTPERPADAAEAMAWFTAEHRVLLAAVWRAGVEGFDGHVWRMAWMLADFLDRRGHGQDRIAAQLAAVKAAQRLGDPQIEARARRGLAIGYVRVNRLEEACEGAQYSLALTGSLGDRRGEAESHRLLCSIEEELGRYDAALYHAQACLEIFRELDDRAGVAGAINSLGWCHFLRGDYAQSARMCEEALVLMRQMPSRLMLAGTLHSLGNAYNRLERHEDAVATFRECVERTRELGDRFYESQALIGLGDASRDAGDAATARAAWQEALDILEQLNHPTAPEVRAKLTS